MIERDLAHLRLMHIVSMKGDYLKQEDIAFILDKKKELKTILESIDEMLETQIIIQEML